MWFVEKKEKTEWFQIQIYPRPENRQQERCTATRRTSVASTRVPRSWPDRVSARIARIRCYGGAGRATILQRLPIARLIALNRLPRVRSLSTFPTYDILTRENVTWITLDRARFHWSERIVKLSDSIRYPFINISCYRGFMYIYIHI